MAYFYRRSSGRFYARIRVPEALQPYFRTQELRRSLQTTDRALACRLALAAALEWKAEFARLSGDMDLEQLIAGSPLLLSGGHIRLKEAASQMGLTVPELFSELKQCRAELSINANGRMGADVTELVFDDGGPGIDLCETLAGQSLDAVTGLLRVRPVAVAHTNGDVFMDVAFHRSNGAAVVFAWPGVELPVGELIALRADCEAVRQRIAASVTREMRDAARAKSLPSQASIKDFEEAALKAAMGEAYKHRNRPCSELLKAFYAEKAAVWAASTHDEAKRFHRYFVELMNDPVIGAIDRDMMRSYRALLQTVPHNAYRLRGDGSRYSGLTIQELIEVAKRDGLPLISLNRADKLVAKIGEVFKWGAKNGFMRDNPADALATTIKAADRVKDEDKRQLFDDAMLQRIFRGDFWLTGRSSKTANGKSYKAAPFKYWIPLLALYSGARRNELAQLYLKDVRVSEQGTWFLDFNLVGDGKLDVDSNENDKQLKTVNARRVVALHPELVRLGLPEYVDALRSRGYKRLFPELSHDKLKGYGKYVGKWFNEELMGKQLGVKRDGTLTFHSFRHTFLTACDRMGMKEHVRNEIAGHSRGSGTGHKSYIKSRGADEQLNELALLQFGLPEIQAFDIPAGLDALADVLAAKERQANRKASKA